MPIQPVVLPKPAELVVQFLEPAPCPPLANAPFVPNVGAEFAALFTHVSFPSVRTPFELLTQTIEAATE